jgi:hypothetical protein
MEAKRHCWGDVLKYGKKKKQNTKSINQEFYICVNWLSKARGN